MGLDETIDRAVDEAVAGAKPEISYWERLRNDWSEGAAEELAKKTTCRVFDSTIFKDAIER